MRGLGTMPRIEKHQAKVQLFEKKWVRRIVGVKRADNRRIEELRVEIGAKESVKKLMTSRMKWAGHEKEWDMENWQRADA